MKVVIELPDYALSIENKREIVEAAGTYVRDSIVSRTRAGQDAEGNPLHQPMDGGKPMDRTGQLIASISWRPNASGDAGMVLPDGARARVEVKNPRKKVEQRLTKSGKPRKTKPKKSRAIRNASVAAILEHPEGRANGSRPGMKVIGLTDADDKHINDVVDDMIEVDLISQGTRTI